MIVIVLFATTNEPRPVPLQSLRGSTTCVPPVHMHVSLPFFICNNNLDHIVLLLLLLLLVKTHTHTKFIVQFFFFLFISQLELEFSFFFFFFFFFFSESDFR